MRIVVVGGGTATNSISPVFTEVAYRVHYVVPISDNGGSTSEILRVFGGPAIGDARSRLVRLVSPSPLRSLLALRLSENSRLAAADWLTVVDGTHPIWQDVRPQMKAMYRAFLVHVHAELLKRTTTLPAFDFSCVSVGNLLLTGARLFFGTLEAAIEFVWHTNRVHENVTVLPCLNSTFSHHIAAQLRNGATVVGQSEISHPASFIENTPASSQKSQNRQRSATIEEDGDLFLHPNLRTPQIQFAKHETKPLPSSIDRVYYVNTYGNEIKPKLSSRVVTNLQMADAVVFSVGSLYTSIAPVLLLQGFATNMPKSKVVCILNGSEDRETKGMTPVDYLQAINKALGDPNTQFVTHVIYPEDLDVSGLINLKCVPAACINGMYVHDSLGSALAQCLKRI